jgi:hypothetical protein
MGVEINLREDLLDMGFKYVNVDDSDPTDVYVKVWFAWKDSQYKTHNDGRKEFCEIGNSREVYDEIIKWIKLPRKSFEIILC